jgi:hypothetical protein
VGTGNTDLMFQNPSPTQSAGKIYSICQDNVNQLSNIAIQTLNVDWTPPTSVTVNDGLGSDINIACTKDTLKANWSNSSDPHSALSKYWYSIGTSPGLTNIKAWTNNGLSVNVSTPISGLVHGQTYYFNVKAENGAGLQSPVSSSNGQTVDTTCINTSAFVFIDYRKVDIYPNPANTNLFIDGIEKVGEFKVEILDITGRIVYSSSLTKTIDVSSYSDGQYLVKIYDKYNHCIYNHKLIIQH